MVLRILVCDSFKPRGSRLYNFGFLFQKFGIYKYSTQSSMQLSNSLYQFISNLGSFNYFLLNTNLKIMRDFEDYKKYKGILKESMNGIESELEHLEFRSLLGILFQCLQISNRVINTKFSLRLLNLLISQIQSNTHSNNSGQLINPQIIDTPKISVDLRFGLSELDNFDSILKDEVYLILILSSFLKFKLHSHLSDHFEFFYMSLNRTITSYSPENLIQLCEVLGDLYLETGLEGLKILLQKSVGIIFERIDKFGVELSVYNWIILIKSISKCKENYLFKRIASYLISSLQSNPTFVAITKLNRFEGNESLKTSKLVDYLNSETGNKYYKFVKLSVHLLNNILTIGLVENPQLLEMILQLLTNYLSSFEPSIHFSECQYSHLSNPYNVTNEKLDRLLYPKYENKVFKSPLNFRNRSNNLDNYHSNSSNTTQLSNISTFEINLLHCNLMRFLYCNKIMFIRGLKMVEMSLRCLYPSLYSRLGSFNLLKSLNILKFDSHKDYIQCVNDLRDNFEVINKTLCDYFNEKFEGLETNKYPQKTQNNHNLLIVPVDIYYLITPNFDDKVYVQLLHCKFGSSNDLNGKTTTFTNTSTKIPNNLKINKNLQFKFKYLESLGWKRINVYI